MSFCARFNDYHESVVVAGWWCLCCVLCAVCCVLCAVCCVLCAVWVLEEVREGSEGIEKK